MDRQTDGYHEGQHMIPYDTNKAESRKVIQVETLNDYHYEGF